MMLTTKGRYAVMAMVDIAAQGQGKPVTLASIEEHLGITTAYLEQLFSRLRRAGIVQSVRGPGGGYLLTRSCEEIMIADIIQAVDEPLKMTRCGNHGDGRAKKSEGKMGCVKGTRCLTHDLWDGLGNQILDYLGGISLEDVCKRNLPHLKFATVLPQKEMCTPQQM